MPILTFIQSIIERTISPLPSQHPTPSPTPTSHLGPYPNTWNRSIHRVTIETRGYLIFFVQPSTIYADASAWKIESAMDIPQGSAYDLQDLDEAATWVIVGLVMGCFIRKRFGNGRPMAIMDKWCGSCGESYECYDGIEGRGIAAGAGGGGANLWELRTWGGLLVDLARFPWEIEK